MLAYTEHLRVIGLQFFKNFFGLLSFGVQVIVPILTFGEKDLEIIA